MKKLCLTVLFLFAFSTVAFASPLMDFSQGKGALDVTLRMNGDGDLSVFGLTSPTVDLKNSVEFGLTLGLGNNLGFQYRNWNPKTKDILGNTFKLDTQEINILYSLDKNFAVFAGLAQGKLSDTTASSKRSNKAQFGFVGSAKLADKLTGFATVGFGSDLTHFEIGAAYELATNTELNLTYRTVKMEKLDVLGVNWDAEVKSLGVGVTFKF